MIIAPENALCYDLLVIPFDDGILDISWSIDTDTIKSLISSSYDKIINFQDLIDFEIQIDSNEDFAQLDNPNLKIFIFSQIENKYRGNIVFSALVPFNKNKFELTEYYMRVKIRSNSIVYNVLQNNQQNAANIQIDDKWSEPLKFTVRKNYTKDIVDIMYKTVADFNSYNKEVKSANFYYLFQAFATSLNEQFSYVQDLKDNHFINTALPDSLKDSFGYLFKFIDVENITMEEYRRILRNLIIGYQNGSAWNYIKEVLKYLVGYTPDLFTLSNFYPWILRNENSDTSETSTPIPDPEDFSDRTYYNPLTNFYLFNENGDFGIYINNEYVYNRNLNKNLIMLFNENSKNNIFIVKTDNYFNRKIDINKIKLTLNLLKSVYTKYNLNIAEYLEPIALNNDLLVNDNNYLLISEDMVLKY